MGEAGPGRTPNPKPSVGETNCEPKRASLADLRGPRQTKRGGRSETNRLHSLESIIEHRHLESRTRPTFYSRLVLSIRIHSCHTHNAKLQPFSHIVLRRLPCSSAPGSHRLEENPLTSPP